VIIQIEFQVSSLSLTVISEANGEKINQSRSMKALLLARSKRSHNPTFLIHHLYTPRFLRHLFLLYGGDYNRETRADLPVRKVKEAVKEAIDYLQSSFDGCGWISGQTNIETFHFDKSKPDNFCPPGDEHLSTFSVDSKQVSNWIFYGSLLSARYY
jgi:hypothetical protein